MIRLELANCEATILREVADRKMRRKDVATTYALAIMSSERDRVDWTKVNTAIRGRWSKSALTYIKRLAWKIVEGER